MIKSLLLRLFIIFIVIFALNTHISNAYTFDDFVDFLKYTKEMSNSVSNRYYNYTRNATINHWADIEREAQAQGYNLGNYNNWLIYNDSSASPNVIYAYSGTINYRTDYNQKNIYIPTQYTFLMIKFPDNASNVYFSNHTRDFNFESYGLIDSEPLNGTYNEVYMQNRWNYIVPRNSGAAVQIPDTPYVFADAYAGSLYSSSNVRFELVDNNGDGIELGTTHVTTLGGVNFALQINNKTNLVNGRSYQILMNYNGNLLAQTDFQVYFWTEESSPGGSGTNGTITNSSGETTGNIDLSGIQNSLNNINDSINSIPDKFYNSGDSGEKRNCSEDL